MKNVKSIRKSKRKGPNLLTRRLLATVLLIFFAGFATITAISWTRPVKADENIDPYFTLSSGPPKVRIYTPVNNSVDNEQSVNVSGDTIPNSTVSVKIDNVSAGITVSDDKGLWSKSVSDVADGNHEVEASVNIGGPLSVISSSMLPGYSVINLENNSLVSSSITGLGFLYNGLLRDSGSKPGAYTAIKSKNSNYVYLVRDRNVLVLDTANYKPLKVIYTGSQFRSSADADASDTNDQYKQAKLSPDGTRLYLLYSYGSVSNAGKILTIDTATNQLISNKTFDLGNGAGATGMAISADGGKIYTVSDGSNVVNVVNTGNNSVSTVALSANAKTIVASADGEKIFISRNNNVDNGSFYIATIDTNTGDLNDNAIDLGTSLRADTLYASKSGDKLYVSGDYYNDLRVVDIASGTVTATIPISDSVQPQASSIIENTDNTRIYFPLRSNKIAIIDTEANNQIAQINPPAGDFSDLGGMIYYNNKIYSTYTRTPGVADITNPSNLYSSLGVADSTITADESAQAIPINGVFSNAISEPVSLSTQTITTTTKFSTGDPIAITSPSNNEPLTTDKPTIEGTGPKGAKIQLVVNSNKPIDVSVGADGKWSTKVTLPKGKNSKITALYQNKRTQLVIPNVFIFGKNISRSQLSVIDGGSDLETQAIGLPNIGVSNISLSTSAAINPNGQRYYLVNDNFSFLPTYLAGVLAGSSEPSPDVNQILTQIASYQIGTIDVYSARTNTPNREKLETINLPLGQLPLGISISPDGKKAMVTTVNIARIGELFSGGTGVDLTNLISPVEIHGVDLEKNKLSGSPYRFPIDLSVLQGNQTPEQTIDGYLSIASVAFFASKSGTYNSDGSKFYTTALSPGKYVVIDTASNQATKVSLPSQYSKAVIMSTQINAKNNTLYATYASVNIPTESNPLPSFTPGLILVNGKNNQYISGSVLPELPIFSFAVSNNGTKVYLETVNLTEFIAALTANISNPSGVLMSTVPRFDLAVYDLSAGTYTAYPITSTEIPINIALSPDGSKVYIPTFAQNVVHVFDTKSKTMDSGNAPIILNGISLMFGTSDYVGEAVLGSYNDSRNYYVPADVITRYIPPEDDGQPDIINYNYLSASQQAAVKPIKISVPEQTANVVQETIRQTAASSQKKAIEEQLKNWLIYAFYALLMTSLIATSIVIWRTDLLIGKAAEETLF